MSRFRAVPVLVAINILVFLLWTFSIHTAEELDFMARNFMVSWTGLTEGHFWILITSVFSHNLFLHLFLNMYVLMNFGQIIEEGLGSFRFLKFYFIAGIVSSVSHAVFSAWVLQEPEIPALGASGSISGLILLFSLMFPKERIYIFGLIPLPAFWGAVAFIGLDIWGLIAQAEGGGLPIGHGAHLGGAFTGVIYYFFFLRPRLSKWA